MIKGLYPPSIPHSSPTTALWGLVPQSWGSRFKSWKNWIHFHQNNESLTMPGGDALPTGTEPWAHSTQENLLLLFSDRNKPDVFFNKRNSIIFYCKRNTFKHFSLLGIWSYYFFKDYISAVYPSKFSFPAFAKKSDITRVIPSPSIAATSYLLLLSSVRPMCEVPEIINLILGTPIRKKCQVFPGAMGSLQNVKLPSL